jgi:hypothetical protein
MLFACGKSSSFQAAQTVNIIIPNDATMLESNGKNYTVFFTPPKEKMPLNHYFDMEVQVRNSMQNIIVFPLKLDVDANMRAHNHGMNVKPIIKNLGNGQYQVKGMLLHMAGEWQLKFTIHRGVLAEQAITAQVIKP